MAMQILTTRCNLHAYDWLPIKWSYVTSKKVRTTTYVYQQSFFLLPPPLFQLFFLVNHYVDWGELITS
jgi:hypothetical protein